MFFFCSVSAAGVLHYIGDLAVIAGLYLLLNEKVMLDSCVVYSYRTVCCSEKCLKDYLTPSPPSSLQLLLCAKWTKIDFYLLLSSSYHKTQYKLNEDTHTHTDESTHSNSVVKKHRWKCSQYINMNTMLHTRCTKEISCICK